ncbi:MAG: NADPH-dependent glutamate synthase [Clostridia bacterium]|nr:NADPH-dependent glutamate synthase [Clostridia bacterium]
MPNMIRTKTPMPEQAPEQRIKNFSEVALGYTKENALLEAQRCLHCKNSPCIAGCPVNVQIPDFIKLIEQGDFGAACRKIRETNSLPAVCGRVCPQESQCEAKCVRGLKGEAVAIGRLERFAADFGTGEGSEAKKPALNGKKVAVVGGGPAGLTCAGDLAARGYKVTVYEALHAAGGVLTYGIPEFRLPKAIVRQEVENLKALGVEVIEDMVIGKVLSVQELFGEMGYSAVFLGTGAGLPSFMGIDGENLIGVYSANEFLTRVNLMRGFDDDYDTPLRPFEHIAVIGGGNVAMDAARCAKRLGAKDVTIVYRRSEAEIPARLEELHHAKQEGIIFHLLTSPVKIIANEKGEVSALECVRMELGEPDASGRRRPVTIEGSNFTLESDCVIMAIGTSPNPLVPKTTPGLETNRHGCIVADEATMRTSLEGVYAGGDAVSGAATVILAMGAGKTAAASIDELLRGKN